MTGPTDPSPREASHARVVAVRGGQVTVREDRLSGEEPWRSAPGARARTRWTSR